MEGGGSRLEKHRNTSREEETFKVHTEFTPQARRVYCREYTGEMVWARSLPVPTTVLGIKLS